MSTSIFFFYLVHIVSVTDMEYSKCLLRNEGRREWREGREGRGRDRLEQRIEGGKEIRKKF